MTRKELWRALQMLPRYNEPNKAWVPRGRHCMTNHKLCPPAIERAVQKIMKRDEPWTFQSVALIDVANCPDLWVLHRRLKWRSLCYLMNSSAWKRWPRIRKGRALKQMPVFIQYKGRYIIWNGTHRTTICCLAGKPLRVKVVDLDKYMKQVRDARRK